MENALTRQNRQLVATGPVGNLEGYLAAVHQIPVLEASEERDLAVRYRDEGDLEAERTLVISHLRFVVHIARGYKGYGLPLADLIQEGNIGLMKAVKRFDPEVGVRLISFAVHWVRAEIHEYILRNWRIVKVATTKAQRKLFFNLRKAKSRLGWFSKNEAEAVASDLGVEPKDVYEMESRLAGQDIRFDPAPESGDDEDAVYSPSAYLPDPDADPARAMENSDWSDKGHDQLMEGFDRLDDRSRDILERRWMREDNRSTLQELATEYGVSAERIRQLEKNAIRKLRKSMTAH